MMRYLIVILLSLICLPAAAISVGAAKTDQYLPLLKGKRVSLVVNHTARVNDKHLLDVLREHEVNVVSVMSPEHGFRGQAAAGEKVADGTDSKTGLPVHSLYGSTKKPTKAMLENVDVLVFDMQDVGTRFYTYLSTLHYVLEAAAEQNISVVVLDRPNPHIGIVDGPVLAPAFQSFVGMHPIPVMHGMTLGELARMIKGESWINASQALRLHVIPVDGYSRSTPYTLPIPPSPNLPNMLAISLYPTLCFFEGTAVSVGRGTATPFQLIGHDQVMLGDTPVTIAGNEAAPSPKLNGKTLQAQRFTAPRSNRIDLALLIAAYQRFNDTDVPFFTRPAFFDKLAGTSALREAIEAGATPSEIRQQWQQPLAAFRARRAPYLLYPKGQAHDEH
ncbi:exo-beta-N-acetylmuramidase NamZ family protein [Alteromonas halophila]|uniref:DUF1343 domain-containing protein n=1 Tax=Alteromonas halophila TaxID=516698 RepID=A0A918JIU5_9ALTE|nr:DUF1343 domain-containing protein [Alteromonas halophila]GGW79483.1 hypothetical protein GCM10007391_10330 [Alteromonas halophila]